MKMQLGKVQLSCIIQLASKRYKEDILVHFAVSFVTIIASMNRNVEMQAKRDLQFVLLVQHLTSLANAVAAEENRIEA